MYELKDTKNRYAEFCRSENLPLFMQPWWLDIVAANNWSVALIEEKGHVVAAHPYLYSRKMGFRIIHQPEFTQHLGPWVTADFKNSKKYLSRKKRALQGLIDQLPEHDIYSQFWHYSEEYWLPFYWRGFQQSTRYTYRIKSLESEEKIWLNLHENIRREIRKAEKRFKLSIDVDASIDDLIHVVDLTFKRQKASLPFSRESFRRIDEKLAKIGKRKIFIARDEQDRIHAGLFLVWDESCAYYLIGGGDPLLRNSGAMSLCMWEALKFSSRVSRSFDFEGSMIEEIEGYFRAFGAELTPYFAVARSSSQIVSLAMAGLKKNKKLKNMALKWLVSIR
ncbi:MAG: GNAT family N-acetyltransferase [Oceanospirillaceae bacterium]|nr:GNAT family N-acetyltransferase [Oceanospirillaceae bacterium]